MDINLKLAILDNLREMNLFQFSIESFFRDQLKKNYNSVASYNYRAYEPVVEFLKNLELDSESLKEIVDFRWDTSSEIIYSIWNQWDGEDDYFHIASLDGIEICPNIKLIKIEYLWKVKDLSPFKNLKGLERLEVQSQTVTPIESLAPLLEIRTLKNVCLEGVKFKNGEETRKVIAELEEKSVQVDIKL